MVKKRGEGGGGSSNIRIEVEICNGWVEHIHILYVARDIFDDLSPTRMELTPYPFPF